MSYVIFKDMISIIGRFCYTVKKEVHYAGYSTHSRRYRWNIIK